MNPGEILEAIEELALEPFDATEFPSQFLRAFGNKETAIQRLRAGNTNQSDVAGALLQRGNIHIATCTAGAVDRTLKTLRDSPKTASQKAKFILATDGEVFQAEDLSGADTVSCTFAEFPNHFGFFLPLAGISYATEIKETELDRRAASRLQRLYVTLLQENPDWADRPQDMNHFMARLIFCFFAEDTDIFPGEGLFSKKIDQMSARDASDTHIVMGEIFRTMDIKTANRESAGVKRYADLFPYVNGQLFSGSTDCPRFSKVSRSYLLHIASLNWQKINPDIFGSMIQAVADEEERDALGMHYTSVPNILKVLNPLFLDDLREALAEAGDNDRKLLNLRKRMAKIRVFDPACGSGNFLVIAYKEMRVIEAEINQRRGEIERRSDIPLTNFRGIELRDFPAEIARLALIIAEYQCDVTYRGQREALAEFLPLNSQNWIFQGNALRIDWLDLMDAYGGGVKLRGDDLFSTPLNRPEIDFKHDAAEFYICGNPPYLGRKYQSEEQKRELQDVFAGRSKETLSLDYVAGWFIKAADFITRTSSDAAFVATNSICQGVQVPSLWPTIWRTGAIIRFALPSFKWSNLASRNAGVTVSIVGLSGKTGVKRTLYAVDESAGNLQVTRKEVENINGYLTAGNEVVVMARAKVPDERAPMQFGNHPYYANDLILQKQEARELVEADDRVEAFVRPIYGSQELISGSPRYCIWVRPSEVSTAQGIPSLAGRIDAVKRVRTEKTKDAQAQKLVSVPFRFRDQYEAEHSLLVVPIVSSENRPYLPVDFVTRRAVVHNKAFALYDAALWNMALIASRLHWVWIGTVCVRMRTDFSYSNTLGWNTFPVPTLTDQNKADLTQCAEEILLAREAHFPATIADLYEVKDGESKMPENLRAAHARNDEVLERIYIGRRFRNDTERLEKLFELYTKMTAKGKAA